MRRSGPGASRRVLVTGGAGFIGSHLVDALAASGWEVRVLDALVSQVHGQGARRPAYLHEDAELVVGDVCDRETVGEALEGCGAVVHLAARVGVGQSMYEMAEYTRVNAVGTATLLECLAERQVDRLVVASSMSIYGEGAYVTPDGAVAEAAPRSRERLAARRWEAVDAAGAELRPVATAEGKRADLSSIYALGKYDQERMCLMFGEAYGVPTVALRLFNVYGTRQALSNPYTGVLAIFASRLLNGRPPMIFEDGGQRRDFVSVRDVVGACLAALESERASGMAINVGSGRSATVAEVAAALARVIGRNDVEAEVTGRFRVGDIRHCFADISLAQEVLGYQPRVTLDEGLRELAQWLRGQEAEDRVDEANAELASRGLTA